MQRAETHKVLGRGRYKLVLSQAPLARVLMHRRAGADVSRYAARKINCAIRRLSPNLVDA